MRDISLPRVVIFSCRNSRIVVPLFEAGMNIVGIVEFGASQPKGLLASVRRIYRFVRSRETPAHRIAREKDIPVYDASSMKDPGLRRWLVERACDVLVVYRVPIIPVDVFSLAGVAINLHPSLLPGYRGGNPLFWAVWDNAATTGCTVHLLEEQGDTGAIVAQKEVPIPDGISEVELERYAEVEIGVPLLMEAVTCISRGNASLIPQPERSPTRYARRRKRHEIYDAIPFDRWTVDRAWRVLRFLDLSPFEIGRGPWLLSFLTWSVGAVDRTPSKGKPGTIARDSRGYYISHAEGRIRLRARISVKSLARRLIDRANLGLRGN
ncbi:MAG: formyltransferase family protein [Woeseia sp.]